MFGLTKHLFSCLLPGFSSKNVYFIQIGCSADLNCHSSIKGNKASHIYAPKHDNLISRVTLNLIANSTIFPKTHRKFSPFPEMLFHSVNLFPALTGLQTLTDQFYGQCQGANSLTELPCLHLCNIKLKNQKSQDYLPQARALLNHLFTLWTF